MSPMEDKELQELFAAKRTVEANRRRQEKLRQMMTTPRSRRLWPVWTLSAAACLALLLITLPPLFRSEAEKPLLAANRIEAIDTIEAIETIETIEGLDKVDSIQSIQSPVSPKPVARPTLTEIADIEEPLAEPEVYEPIVPVSVETVVQEQEPAGPTIHRRTSSRMVCSNCSIDNAPSTSTAFHNFLAATFGTAANNPIPLETIEL